MHSAHGEATKRTSLKPARFAAPSASSVKLLSASMYETVADTLPAVVENSALCRQILYVRVNYSADSVERHGDRTVDKGDELSRNADEQTARNDAGGGKRFFQRVADGRRRGVGIEKLPVGITVVLFDRPGFHIVYGLRLFAPGNSGDGPRSDVQHDDILVEQCAHITPFARIYASAIYNNTIFII